MRGGKGRGREGREGRGMDEVTNIMRDRRQLGREIRRG